MKKNTIFLSGIILALVGAWFFQDKIQQAFGATILFPQGGGTGKGTATTTDSGLCLVVSSTNPLSYKFSACGGSGQVATGTAGQFPYYASNTTTLTATSAIFVTPTSRIGINSTSPIATFAVQGMTGVTPFSINSSSGDALLSIERNATYGDYLLTIPVPPSTVPAIKLGTKFISAYGTQVQIGSAPALIDASVVAGQFSVGGGNGIFSSSGITSGVTYPLSLSQTGGYAGGSSNGIAIFSDGITGDTLARGVMVGVATSSPTAGVPIFRIGYGLDTSFGYANAIIPHTEHWLFQTSLNTTSVYNNLNVSNNVSIGTTSPTAKLTVVGTTSIAYVVNVVSSSGASYLTILNDGKVMIGTTTPGLNSFSAFPDQNITSTIGKFVISGQTDGEIRLSTLNESSDTFGNKIRLTDGAVILQYGTGGGDNIIFNRGGVQNAWLINGNSYHFTPGLDNQADVGGAGLQIRNLYFGTSVTGGAGSLFSGTNLSVTNATSTNLGLPALATTTFGNCLQLTASGTAFNGICPSFANFSLYFQPNSSSITGYKVMEANTQTGDVSYTTTTVTTTNQLLMGWVSNTTTPNMNNTVVGTYYVHIHAFQSAGIKNAVVYAQIFTRTSGGVETLLGTTNNSVNITSADVSYDLSVYIPATTTPTTNRFVVKVYSSQVGTGTDPEVVIGYSNFTGSSLNYPRNAADISILVPYTGALQGLDMGAFGVSSTYLTTNNATTTNLNVSSLANILKLGINSSSPIDTLGVQGGLQVVGTGVTSTNMFVSGLLSYLNANGTSLTSTNAFFTNVSSTNATTTNLYTKTGNFLFKGFSIPSSSLAVAATTTHNMSPFPESVTLRSLICGTNSGSSTIQVGSSTLSVPVLASSTATALPEIDISVSLPARTKWQVNVGTIIATSNMPSGYAFCTVKYTID